ncbi:MAG: amino acid permease [Rickettsiaceae bacterium]
MGFFTRKSFESIKLAGATSGLNKTLGAADLVLLGLGGIIGTGVFVFTGLIAAECSGPAVTLSYTIAGVTCIFVAFVYAELSTMIPTSGSIYTFSYIAFGQGFAWIMASVIILELGFAAATVAAGWSGYTQSLLGAVGIHLPEALTNAPGCGRGIINIPAVFISGVVCFVLYLGTKDSKRLNAILVIIKIVAIFAFIIFAFPYFDISNWNDFMPFGTMKMLKGASILFFAYSGFNTIATAAEECKNPKRDLMIGIIGSLVLATMLYVLVAGLLTGITSYTNLNSAHSLSYALMLNGNRVGFAIVATGAICGMTTVLMLNIYGQSRVFYVISRDGLLPKFLSKLHPKYDSPYVTIMIFSLMTAGLSGFCSLEILGQMSSMGALIDYITVAIIVMLFRFTLKDVPRSFKCPIVFIIAPIIIITCTGLLMTQVFEDGYLILSGKLIIAWFVLMLILYFINQFCNRRKVAG